MISLLDDIKQNIPSELNSQVLSDFLTNAEKYSDDAEFITDSNSAKEFADIIGSLFAKYSKEPNADADIQKRLKNIEIKLRWLNPSDLESNYRKELMSNGLVKAITMGVDVMRTLDQYLFVWENGFQPDEVRRSNLIYDLVNNQEVIGANQIVLSDRETVVSSVQNWIKDYISGLPVNNLGGGFEKITYLTQSPNVKKLNPQEKEILTKVIDIYRFLKTPQGNFATPVPDTDVVPVVAAPPKSQPALPSIPVPNTPQPITVPVPASPINPAKSKSAFDQKLAQVSAPTPHGESLEMLKHRLEEVKPVPAPVAPVKPSPPTPLPGGEGSIKLKMTPTEIKREVTTAELPGYKAPVLPAPPKPVAPPLKMPIPQAPVAVVKPPVTPQQIKPIYAAVNNTPGSFKVMDDLKKIEIGYLRKGSLQSQIANIKSSIQVLARANNLLPFYVVQAFEQSPLFKSYLAHGGAIFGGGAANTDLSQEEFEAMADLRNELERM